MEKCVVLTSGGLDSTTTLAIAKSLGFELYALTFDYGQRHRREINSAKKAAQCFAVKEHRIIVINLRSFGGSALTDDITMPVREKPGHINGNPIPITYVPARNTIFLAYALAWAEVIKAHDIFIGVSALDYSGYPDCRPEYIGAFQKMADLATKEAVEGNPVRIRAPLISLSKADTIRRGIELGVDYSITHSCYNPTPSGLACGACDSCLLRRKGFLEAGIEDPATYARPIPTKLHPQGNRVS
ncbi:MAG: 7-cyano-7-deazaguanine synthase QueC [Syntrophorhabdus aromaticivorans]|uniref:7-cyano-7-deazaguanine synthase n=1 Tax=Syntrophorhabdus aromaticivorans TaxID=328301 RepID=A0A971M4K0_9BACT|nr:7-cyano-7-deazaguanine synthase QueC [Syntrophorhabdus aromaticivorans]